MEVLRYYGIGATVYFPLIATNTTDFISAVSFATGDIKLNGTNTTNTPTSLGNGMYSLVLTNTEMQTEIGRLTIIDQTNPKVWQDQAVLIQTYGSYSGSLPWDFTGNVNMTQILGEVESAELLWAGVQGLLPFTYVSSTSTTIVGTFATSGGRTPPVAGTLVGRTLICTNSEVPCAFTITGHSVAGSDHTFTVDPNVNPTFAADFNNLLVI